MSSHTSHSNRHSFVDILTPNPSQVFSPEAIAEAEDEQRRRQKLKALQKADSGEQEQGSDESGEESDDSFM